MDGGKLPNHVNTVLCVCDCFSLTCVFYIFFVSHKLKIRVNSLHSAHTKPLQEGRVDSEPLVDDGREVTVVASWQTTPYWGSNDGRRPIFDGARSAWILSQKLQAVGGSTWDGIWRSNSWILHIEDQRKDLWCWFLEGIEENLLIWREAWIARWFCKLTKFIQRWGMLYVFNFSLSPPFFLAFYLIHH